MTDANEFLEGWFAAFYRFDGLILVLEAFFDETGSGDDDELTAVAGVRLRQTRAGSLY